MKAGPKSWTIGAALHLAPVAGLAVMPGCGTALAQQSPDLATAAQNPIAAMYSLPFQNNTYGDAGPSHDKTANVLNIQPILPFSTGNWNIISRTIAPLIYLPSFATGLDDATTSSAGGIGNKFGLGDINQSFYFSPAAAEGFIWGVGPSFTLPTATDKILGSGKFSMGPAAVALVTPKPWVIGILARQLWSVAGPNGRKDVSQTLLQPFVNYNLPEGWYLVTSPIITANWTAESSQRWSVPVGGGVGKIFKFGDQPMNGQLQFFDYAQAPSGGPRWAVRFQLQFLFPK
jgi:hypothetical protein